MNWAETGQLVRGNRFIVMQWWVCRETLLSNGNGKMQTDLTVTFSESAEHREIVGVSYQQYIKFISKLFSFLNSDSGSSNRHLKEYPH